MKQLMLLASLGLAACDLAAHIAPEAPSAAPAQTGAALPDHCTGPNRGNFNGARLSRAVIAQIPGQFEQDRSIMRAALQGQATETQLTYLRQCHGLTL